MQRSRSISCTDRVLVGGAGPAGLAAALYVARRGGRPTVFEQISRVGGHARTETFQGYRFDIGGHRFFTRVSEIESLWEELLGERFLRVARQSRIYYRSRFFQYPLRLGDVVAGLGVWNSMLMTLSFIRARLRPYRQEETFEQWVVNRFGRRLYETFFKTYTEKVWGIPCNQIRADWAAQRIRHLSFVSAVTDALGLGAGRAKSLVNEFRYPELGPGQMWEAAMHRIVNDGGDVELNSRIVAIRRAGTTVRDCVILSPEGERVVEADAFLFSLALPDVLGCMEPLPPPAVLEAASRLRYRDFLTVCVIVDHPDLFPDNWIYVHDPGINMGRLQNFKNWSAAMVPDPSKTSLGAEFFVSRGDRLWQMDDDDLIALTVRELEALSITRGARIEAARVYRQRRAYPVYDDTYRDALGTIRTFIDSLDNAWMIGRNGLHRYNNQDHSMLTGMLAVDNIAGAAHDLWSVNENEQYHEGAVVGSPDAADWVPSSGNSSTLSSRTASGRPSVD